MAVVAVAYDAGAGGRLNAADVTTNWTGWGTGCTATQEVDFIYQNTNSISCKVKATTDTGIYYTSASTDMTTPKVWLAKVLVTNKDALASTTYMRLRIGSSTTVYYYYQVFTNLTYPIAGGWQIIPIDPNVSGYRTAVGSPNLAAVVYFALNVYISTTAKAENIAVDAIDVFTSGTGLTLTGGDGADADGTFTSFVTFDEGTAANRYGIVTTREGVLYVLGVLTIGSATATVFTDSYVTVVFPNGRFNTGFCGIKVSLASATTVVTMTSIPFVGRGSYGYDGGTADTRPIFTVTSTSGTLALTSCILNNFAAITFTSTVTASNSSFIQCLSLTQASATLTGCVFYKPAVATGIPFLTSNAALGSISNCTFTSSGTGHAITITSTTGSPFTFTGNKFTSYSGTPGSNLVASSGSNDAAIYNNSSGSITINITGGGDTPSVRNGAGASTTINNNVNITITVQDAAANVLVGCQVAMFKTSDDSAIIASTATNASGQVTGSVAASTGACYIRVRQSTNTGSFNTNTDVNGSTETITITAHSFVDGEKVVYRKNGGSASINASLVEGFTCYVNSTGTNTLQLYDTAANAITGTATGRYDLTATTAETHSLDPVRYYPNSTVGTIGTVDFDVTVTLIEDTTVTG